MQSSAQDKDSIQLVKQGQKLLEFVDANFEVLTHSERLNKIEKSLIIFQKINSWEGIIDSYNFLAYTYYFKKDFNKSENYVILAKDLAEKKLGEESDKYRDAYTNLTTYRDIAGFKEEAIEEYQKIIVLEKKYANSRAIEAVVFHNLGTAYVEIGEYEEAIDALNNAIRIRKELEFENDIERIKNEIDIGGIYSDLAGCYKQKNNIDKAIAVFENSLELLNDFDKDDAYVNQIRYNCYYKLAEIFLDKGDYTLSLQYVNQALEIKNKNSVFDDCYSYLTLGKIHIAQGENKKALLNFDQAIKSATNEADGFANFPQIAITYTEKGNAYLQLSSFDEALSTFQKGLQITALDFNEIDVKKNPSLDQIIQKLGTLDLITGKAKAFLGKYKSDQNQENLNLASEHYLLATQIIQTIREGYNTAASKHILAGKANHVYEQAIEVCDLLYQKTNDVKHIKQAFLFAESNKSITLLESMTKETALSLSGIPDTLLGLERSLNIKLKFAERQLGESKSKKEGNNQETVNRLEQERFELKESYKRLIDQIEKEYPKYYELKYAYENASVFKIQKDLLDDQTALLEYFVGEQFIYSFLILKNDFKIKKIERSEAHTTQINELRNILNKSPESLTFVGDYKRFAITAHNLYQSLIGKEFLDVADNVKNLIIIQDGILGSFPFDVLLTENADSENANYSIDNLSYLMKRFAISYNYSSSLFFNKQKKTPPSEDKKFIAFAPSFNDQLKVAERTCSDSDLYSLKCSAEEVSKINEIFDGEKRIGPSSTKSTFLNEVSGYSIVHLATHACVNEENEMLHRIHFADDYVTPYDLYNLKLNADLVVLSACNTGTGKVVKGEGVMSLSRGFIQSGSASTLMSLWSVDDCATSDLMISFYDQLRKGDTKNIALQKAKINYINAASDKAKAHPYYWAAFTQFGDTDAINIKTKNSFLPYALLALGILGSLFFFIKRRRS